MERRSSNVGGNKYRPIAAIHYNCRKVSSAEDVGDRVKGKRMTTLRATEVSLPEREPVIAPGAVAVARRALKLKEAPAKSHPFAIPQTWRSR